MNTSPVSNDPVARREFLKRTLAIGAPFCFGCPSLLSLTQAQEKRVENTFQEKISQQSGMTYDQIFQFAYRDAQIPFLVSLSKQVGRERFIEMIKAAIDDAWSKPEVYDRFFKSLDATFWSHVVEAQIIERSETRTIQKSTNCLWAKTFRESNAADLGYALVCYSDFPIAKSQGQKLVRSKCLMQGDECCQFEWTKQS